jgi:DNA-directed RNA polymerase subunit alpha
MTLGQPPMSNPVMLRPVEELELSNWVADLLKEANIYYIGDLVQRTGAELVQRRNIPERAVVEIRKALRARGLDLGGG